MSSPVFYSNYVYFTIFIEEWKDFLYFDVEFRRIIVTVHTVRREQ